jgi:hypothetical protein
VNFLISYEINDLSDLTGNKNICTGELTMMKSCA